MTSRNEEDALDRGSVGWVPPCPYLGRCSGRIERRGQSPDAGCRCGHDVLRAVEEALARVFGDLASKAALGLDKRSAIAAIARAEAARNSDKSVSRAVHSGWTAAHEAVHGALPCDRTMRRYYREAFPDAPDRAEGPPAVTDGGDAHGRTGRDDPDD